jgi:hypothetical protein
VAAVRNWLRTTSKRHGIRGATEMASRYVQFRVELPAICRAARLDASDLAFLDYRTLIEEWVAAHRVAP